MTQKSPATVASAAAEAIRELNHRTLPHSGASNWEMPGDAYTVVGCLALMAQRLGQAVTQAEQLIKALDAEGHLYALGGSVGYTVTEVHTYTRDATASAEQLARALGLMQAALGRLGYED